LAASNKNSSTELSGIAPMPETLSPKVPPLLRTELKTMHDLWYLLLIVIFAALIFGLTYGCAALVARK
jgi:hypothetical protein